MNNKPKISFFILALLWAGFIYYLSDIPDLKSSLPSLADLILRKIAHVSEYLALTYLLARGFNQSGKKYLLYSVLLGLLYAAGDEWHQTRVFGRQGSVTDWIIDGGGSLLGVAVYHWSLLKINKKSSLGYARDDFLFKRLF